MVKIERGEEAQWADAIANRIVNECTFELSMDQFDMFKQTLSDVFIDNVPAMEALIGTSIIGEGYFDESLEEINNAKLV